MDKDKVLGLAKLARIDISDTEAEKLSNEFDAILGYVGEVKKLAIDDKRQMTDDLQVRNIMREDGEPHESGIYTESILKNAPSQKNNYIKVKKIM